MKTPPRVSGKIMIRESDSDSWPTAQVETNMASSSQPEVGWQATFKLGDKPLPVSTNVRTWAQGKGGRVAQSLVQGLLLLEDVQFFSDGTEELLARQLQWHTIVVTFYPSLFHLF